MLTREDDWALGPEQLGIGRRPRVEASGTARPHRAHPFRIRREPPGDGDRLAEQVRTAGVQGLNGLAADANALLVGQSGEGVRIVPVSPTRTVRAHDDALCR